MAERINPYVAGAPVTDAAIFFGREDVFAWIEQNIAGRYADNTLVLHGQRRVGKTSVLKQLEHRLSDRYAPIFFDLQGRTHATLDRFLWRLAREITRTLRSRYDLDLPPRSKNPSPATPSISSGRSWPRCARRWASATCCSCSTSSTRWKRTRPGRCWRGT